MQVDLPLAVPRLEEIVQLSPPSLLADMDARAVLRNVRDLDTESAESVDGATGLLLRFLIPASQVSTCCRKVTTVAFDCVTTLSKYSLVSTSLAAMISLALRSRSDAES
jgi:hypothetical protein